MIIFETQEDFERAVMEVVLNKIHIDISEQHDWLDDRYYPVAEIETRETK